MSRISKLHKLIGLICAVATLTIALSACTSEKADNEMNEGNAPQASVAALADALRSDEPVKLLTPSNNASALEDREVKWKVMAPNVHTTPVRASI
jgi:hypothetical protein